MTEVTAAPLWVRVVNGMSKLLVGAAGLVLLVMMLHVCADVASRIVTDRPLNGTLEYVSFWWMPAIVFAAMAGTEARGEHIRATLLVERLSPRMSRVIEGFTLIVVFALVILMTYYAFANAMDSAQVKQAALGTAKVPIWPLKYFATACMAALALQLVASLYRVITEERVNHDHHLSESLAS